MRWDNIFYIMKWGLSLAQSVRHSLVTTRDFTRVHWWTQWHWRRCSSAATHLITSPWGGQQSRPGSTLQHPPTLVLLGHQKSERNKKFWKELIVYFPLIGHRPHRKRRIQQFFYYWVRICSRGNVFTKTLPSNERGIHVQTQIMGRTYELCRSYGLRCYDMHTNQVS